MLMAKLQDFFPDMLQNRRSLTGCGIQVLQADVQGAGLPRLCHSKVPVFSPWEMKYIRQSLRMAYSLLLLHGCVHRILFRADL